jgi:hypothetical protein
MCQDFIIGIIVIIIIITTIMNIKHDSVPHWTSFDSSLRLGLWVVDAPQE